MSTGIELIPIFILMHALTGAAGVKALGGISSMSTDGFSNIEPEILEKSKARRDLKNREFLDCEDEIETARLEKTVMNNEELLLKTLDDYGCEYAVAGDSVRAVLGDHQIVFKMSPGGGYEAGFVNYINTDLMRKTLQELGELYAQNVQQRVYENVMSRARERGLIFETEETGKDNSIVLTFLVE